MSPTEPLTFRARLEDREVNRWSIVARNLQQVARIAEDQRATVIWVRRLDGPTRDIEPEIFFS